MKKILERVYLRRNEYMMEEYTKKAKWRIGHILRNEGFAIGLILEGIIDRKNIKEDQDCNT